MNDYKRFAFKYLKLYYILQKMSRFIINKLQILERIYIYSFVASRGHYFFIINIHEEPHDSPMN